MIAAYHAVPLAGEWLEQFWCDECQHSTWYHIHKVEDRVYQVHPIPAGLWQNASKVINPERNPSVSEYTFRASRGFSAYGVKGFRSLN